MNFKRESNPFNGDTRVTLPNSRSDCANIEAAKPVSPFKPDSTMDEKRSPVESQQPTQVIITFDSNDPENPNNWSNVSLWLLNPVRVTNKSKLEEEDFRSVHHNIDVVQQHTCILASRKRNATNERRVRHR